MRIIIVRHAKPTLPQIGRIPLSRFQYWVDRYNSAELDPTCLPTEQVLELSQQCGKIVSSDMLRSQASAQLLKQPFDSLPGLAEVDLPKISFPTPKLNPALWLILLRLAWFIGFSPRSESKPQVKQRAREAAIRLQHLAQQHGCVMLIGHGFFNRFLVKALLASKQWRGPKNPGARYWECATYEPS